jgi:1,2-phenylacetyl-CoA epoxidase catalytic subunit
MESPMVLAWCDDLFLQSHQLSKWITEYVDLEESLAVGSIAQELLAHSAALMGTVGLTALDRDERIFRRPSDEWFPSASSRLPEHDWPGTVARCFLVNRAMLTLREHLVFPGGTRAQRLAEVINAEQNLHAQHWERWIAIFGAETDLRDEFAASFAAAATDAADLFGAPESAVTDELFDAGRRASAHRRCWAGIGEILGRHGHVMPDVPDEPRPRASGEGFVDEVIRELRFARSADGESHYKVYQ